VLNDKAFGPGIESVAFRGRFKANPFYQVGACHEEGFSIAYCSINVDRGGNVKLDYIKDDVRERTELTSFEQFVEIMTRATHTFTSFPNNELDACLNLHPSPHFKVALLTSSHMEGGAYDSLTDCTFYWTLHKLNIRSGRKYWHVLDVSDLSRMDSYKLRPLHSADEVKAFTVKFIVFCQHFNLLMGNNFTWSELARNFLLRTVPRTAWPNWNNETEKTFQGKFLSWYKGPHHGTRVLGTFTSSDFDRIRSHLRILGGLPSHSPEYTDYIESTRYNPGALYASYFIECDLPQLPFMPWRVRMASDFTPEVYGEQRVVVLQPNLRAAVEVLGLVEGKHFKVLKSYQVVSRDGYERYPYREPCLKMERLMDAAPKGIHAKSMYHRFIGMMFHMIEGSEKLIASTIFDPMVATTIWAEEYARVWTALMGSIDPHMLRVDGGSALDPDADEGRFSVGIPGVHLAYNAQYKDKTGETDVRERVLKQRDKTCLVWRNESSMGLAETVARLQPFGDACKTFIRERSEHPQDPGRRNPKIPYIGVLLDGSFETHVFSEEEAKRAAWEREKNRSKQMRS